MLKFYFTTVLIWMVIIYAVFKLTAKTIIDNGWLDNAERKRTSKAEKWEYLAMVAAIPIFRFFFVAMAFYMAGTKKKNEDK